MEYHAGIDVSLELSSICVVGATGKVVKEAKVASDPAALVAFFKGLGFPVTRIGLEAGPLSQWLHAGLTRSGFETVLLETRHVKAALSAMTVKTDRKDARRIAQLMRMGWFRPVHAKSPGAQEVRALLVARKQLQSKLLDIEARVRELTAGQAMLERVTTAMLDARAAKKNRAVNRSKRPNSAAPAGRIEPRGASYCKRKPTRATLKLGTQVIWGMSEKYVVRQGPSPCRRFAMGLSRGALKAARRVDASAKRAGEG